MNYTANLTEKQKIDYERRLWNKELIELRKTNNKYLALLQKQKKHFNSITEENNEYMISNYQLKTKITKLELQNKQLENSKIEKIDKIIIKQITKEDNRLTKFVIKYKLTTVKTLISTLTDKIIQRQDEVVSLNNKNNILIDKNNKLETNLLKLKEVKDLLTLKKELKLKEERILKSTKKYEKMKEEYLHLEEIKINQDYFTIYRKLNSDFNSYKKNFNQELLDSIKQQLEISNANYTKVKRENNVLYATIICNKKELKLKEEKKYNKKLKILKILKIYELQSAENIRKTK
jgi:hypothetical protein